MATKVVPLRNDVPNYSFSITLDGAVYQMEFQWNERCSVWTFDLRDVNGLIIVGSIPVIVNYPLLYQYKDLAVPPGALFFWDSTGKNQDVQSITDLGNRVILFYQEFGTDVGS